MYQKSMGELKPSYSQRRQLVDYLIEESAISPISKNYLRDAQNFVPHYAMRGFKYGLASSTIVFLFCPVVRR